MLGSLTKFVTIIYELRELWSKQEQGKRWHIFAHVLVPLIVLMCWMSAGELFILSPDVSHIEMQSELDKSGKISVERADLLVFNANAGEYSVLLEERSYCNWVSLDKKSIRQNKANFQLHDNSISIRLPLLGIRSQPLAILVSGGIDKELAIPGQSISLSEKSGMGTPSAQYLVLWGFIAVIFSFGLTIGTGEFT